MPKALETRKITKTVCDAVRTTGKRYVVWDTDLKGFGLRVAANGQRTFVVRYRRGGGRADVGRLYSLGRYGILTADEARRLAKETLAAVTAGEDPQAERAKKRAEMTLAELCDEYVAKKSATKSQTTLTTDRSRIERHIKPLLGRRRLSDLSVRDIAQFQTDVINGKTAVVEKTGPRGLARVTGGAGTARRTLGLLGAILAYAVNAKLIAENPVRGIERGADKKADRFLTGAELARLGAALSSMEADGAHPYGIAIIRLLALTGARKSEIAGLRWAAVDLERSNLTLETSKTGAKVITLAPGAAAILGALDRQKGNPYVFPAKSGTGHYQGAPKVWEAARLRADLSDVRLHDLRHTYASTGAAGGFGLPVIGALLGHRAAETTKRYAHLADDPRRKANDWIAGQIAEAMGPRPVASNG
jgi:integrase